MVYGSIHNEINAQIAALRKQGKEPLLIRLGQTASAIYAWECWCYRISEAPKHHKGHECLVPILYRDKLSGVVVEGD